jgi:hypothetical protein
MFVLICSSFFVFLYIPHQKLLLMFIFKKTWNNGHTLNIKFVSSLLEEYMYIFAECLRFCTEQICKHSVKSTSSVVTERKKAKSCMCGIHYISKGRRHEIFLPKSLHQIQCWYTEKIFGLDKSTAVPKWAYLVNVTIIYKGVSCLTAKVKWRTEETISLPGIYSSAAWFHILARVKVALDLDLVSKSWNSTGARQIPSVEEEFHSVGRLLQFLFMLEYIV